MHDLVYYFFMHCSKKVRLSYSLGGEIISERKYSHTLCHYLLINLCIEVF